MAWPILFLICSPFFPTVFKEFVLSPQAVCKFFHIQYFFYNVHPLTWSRRVRFQPAPCDGLFTRNYQDFKNIGVFFSNYTFRDQSQVHNPGVTGNLITKFPLQNINNIDPKCLKFYTRPEHMWVIGELSTWSPTVLLSIQLSIFYVWCNEKTVYVFPSEFPPSFGASRSVLGFQYMEGQSLTHWQYSVQFQFPLLFTYNVLLPFSFCKPLYSLETIWGCLFIWTCKHSNHFITILTYSFFCHRNV